jgi:hypothetical protein
MDSPVKVKPFQPVLALKPTQFAVGVLEVEYKVGKLKSLKRRKLKRYLRDTPVPIVISPWKELCIVDHHHFVFACWHADVKCVRVEVVENFSRSQLSYSAFWKMMAKEQFAYLFDQFGDGPRSPIYLPIDIRGMADDPYRSLAWMIRKEGGFENSAQKFAEFEWADYFRKNRLLHSHGRSGFHRAIRRGLSLARSPKAARLPGFIPSQRQSASMTSEGKSRYVSRRRKKGTLATKPVLRE